MDGRPRPTSGCPSVLRLPDVHKESETPSTSGEGERKFTESSSKVTGMRRLNLTQQNTKIQKDTKKKEAEASWWWYTVWTQPAFCWLLWDMLSRERENYSQLWIISRARRICSSARAISLARCSLANCVLTNSSSRRTSSCPNGQQPGSQQHGPLLYWHG